MKHIITKRLRLAVALIFMVATTLILVAAPGVGGIWFGIQPGPSWVNLFGGIAITGITVTIVLLVTTLIFGRWFCAVLCPLGALQDVGCLTSRKTAARGRDFKTLRYGLAIVSLALAIGGWVGMFRLLDPFSRFAAFISSLKNMVAASAANMPMIATGSVIGGLAPIFVLALLVVWRRRVFCVSLCPVGTVFGLAGRFSLYRLRLTDACNGCGQCATQCPTDAIDTRSRCIDNELCVLCMACVSACRRCGITYGRLVPSGEETAGGMATNPERRQFLLTGASVAIGMVAAGSFLSPAIRKLAHAAEDGKNLVLPPGAFGAARFTRQCTGCMACAAGCPVRIIKPSPYGFGPVRLDYSDAGCAFDCTACNSVCPSGALRRLELANKQWLKIGEAVFEPALCRVVTEGVACSLCAQACPTGAIFLPDGVDGLQLPEIASFHCIGCGACQAACPVRPKAINVNAVEQENFA